MEKKLLIITLLSLASIFHISAKVYPGAPFNDGMVLQRETKVNLWGKATPGSTVTIMASWNYKTFSTTTSQEGKWYISIPTPKASFTPYSITLNDGTDPVIIRDVLIGDVWFASGQSNMDMPLSGWEKCPIVNSAQAVASTANYSGKLHYAFVPHLESREPKDSVSAQWKNSTPENMKHCSAVAFYFASTIINKMNIPVGIIFCSYGGSTVEAWMPKEQLQNYPEVDLSDSAYKKINQQCPAVLYNAMLKPLIGYTIKGFIWYQGESNVGLWRDYYASHFSAMINEWRKEWKQGNLPFYYVEITPFKYGNSSKIDAAILREQQYKALKLTKNTGIVGTNDCITAKEEDQIHPSQKQPIGTRLANWALAKVYKQDNIHYQHPAFKSLKIKRNRAYLAFTNTPNGFNRLQDIHGFEICGTDSIFKPAKATVKDKQIMLTSPDVETPVAVRYCFKNFQLGNLANKEGLPLIPFRTDKFEK